MSDKKKLAQDLAGSLVAILFGCLVVIMIIVNLPNTKELDGALIANVLTGGVTLFAPIAAYYLLSDWKEQHNTNIEKEYLKEIFDEFRKYNSIVFNYVKKAREFIIYENNFKQGQYFTINPRDIDDFQKSYNHLLTIMGEYQILSKDEKVKNYFLDYDNLSRNSFGVFEGIHDLNVNSKENTEEENKRNLQDYLMKEVKLTISKKEVDCKYWNILVRFEHTHNDFYKYLINNKLIK